MSTYIFGHASDTMLLIYTVYFHIPAHQQDDDDLVLLTEDNAWWRHQMETFSTLLAICAGNSPVPGEFPTQRPVTQSFDVYFDLRPNKRLSKQSLGWWFETLSPPLWRHRNGWTLHEDINAMFFFLLNFHHCHWKLSKWTLVEAMGWSKHYLNQCWFWQLLMQPVMKIFIKTMTFPISILTLALIWHQNICNHVHYDLWSRSTSFCFIQITPNWYWSMPSKLIPAVKGNRGENSINITTPSFIFEHPLGHYSF